MPNRPLVGGGVIDSFLAKARRAPGKTIIQVADERLPASDDFRG
ncbi:hypothetical protein [Micromonospora zamorensis]